MLFYFLKIIADLVGVEWLIFVVLIYISLMVNGVEILSCSHWPLLYFLWRSVYSHPLIWVAYFCLLLRSRGSLYLADMWITNIFCLFLCCLFTLFNKSFEIQNFLTLMKFNSFFCVFCYPKFMCLKIPPYFLFYG